MASEKTFSYESVERPIVSRPQLGHFFTASRSLTLLSSRNLEDFAETLVGRKNPCVVIGGFPHGHFSAGTLAVLDELVRIDSRALDAHVVASRAVYEVEKRLMRADA